MRRDVAPQPELDRQRGDQRHREHHRGHPHIVTTPREAFCWLTVLVTFALGTGQDRAEEQDEGAEGAEPETTVGGW